MKRTKKEKGITLVALIITIVVLLILAVVAINAVTGDGIIQHATNAKTSYQNAQAKENSTIEEYVGFLENKVTAIEGKVKLIKFTIRNNQTLVTEEYTAEEGMTWEKWVNSKYNTANYYVTSSGPGDIRSSEGELYLRVPSNTEFIEKDMVIVRDEYGNPYILDGLDNMPGERE